MKSTKKAILYSEEILLEFISNGCLICISVNIDFIYQTQTKADKMIRISHRACAGRGNRYNGSHPVPVCGCPESYSDQLPYRWSRNRDGVLCRVYTRCSGHIGTPRTVSYRGVPLSAVPSYGWYRIVPSSFRRRSRARARHTTLPFFDLTHFMG